MSVFGLDAAQVKGLVVAVSPTQPDLDADAVADRFARAAWSVIAEPGDGAAGALIRERGAAEALRFVLSERHPGGSTRDERTAETVAGLARWRPRLRSWDVERALQSAARVGATLLVPDAASVPPTPWPRGVSDLGDHAPIALWARGAADALGAGGDGSSEPGGAIALVGARAATGYGEHVASELSAGLVRMGMRIVSGAAYGIDGMAHRAALASGGLTIAFLAGGVDRFYPAGHDELIRRISQHGLVVSEVPCGAAPTKWRFLQRNRLIAASTAATVVVEAGARSGSLNTAGHASALGRPIGAIPGPVTSPASAGCHRLLREYDAICVTNAVQVAELVGVLEPLPASDTPEMATDAPSDSPETVRVIDALSTRSPRTPADIAARSGLTIGGVLSVLGVLELEGRVGDGPDGWRAKPQGRPRRASGS